ncbi:hypothetical protein Tco_1234819 [Tanacetum coccineum]
MSKVLQERGFGSLPSSTETNPRDQVKSISTTKANFSEIRHIECGPYVVSGTHHRSVFSKIVPFPRRLQNFGCDDWREAQDVKILDAYDHTLPQKEKDPGSFTLPCFIHNICFDKALVGKEQEPYGDLAETMIWFRHSSCPCIFRDCPFILDILLPMLEMNLLSFIHTTDPTKMRIGERQRAEDEPKLLDTIVGCVVPLLPIAPARAENEVDASVQKLFDESGSAAETVVEDVTPMQPKRLKKQKTIIVDAGEPSHPSKRLRDDHGTPGGPDVGGKSRSLVQLLLAGAMQNAEVRGEAMPTLPFVTSSVSTTPEHEGGDHTESLAGADLCTIGAPTSVPIMTSVTTTTPSVDPAVIAKEKLVGSFVFGANSSSAGGSHPIPGGFSNSTSSDFLIGGIRTMSLSAEVRMHAEYNIKEKRRLKSVVDEQTEQLKVREKEIESLKAQLLVKEAEATEAIRLCVEASKFEVFERSLLDEAQVLKERNTTLEKEKSELEIKVADLTASLKVREQKVGDLDVVATSVNSRNDSLVDQVHGLETSSAGLQEKVTAYESCIDQLEKFQDDKMKEVNDKFDQLYTDFIEMALHLEEKFYPHLLTTIFGRRWLLTHGMELAIAKCLNSTEYLSTLRAAIGKAVEKGMQDGLSARIIHGAEGRNLTDVAAYNPSAEADYISALQRL